jgi:hypothetical protein
MSCFGSASSQTRGLVSAMPCFSSVGSQACLGIREGLPRTSALPAFLWGGGRARSSSYNATDSIQFVFYAAAAAV